MTTRYWLMKSEPESFSIADLRRVKVEPWTGVRSYFARLHMRAMSVGDLALFHHSNASPSGVAGVARIVRTRVVDETQFDPDSKYYEPKATREAPVWDCVDVEYVETLPYHVSMDRLRGEPALTDMLVLKRGMRLSVMPVTEDEFRHVVSLGHTPPQVAPAKPKAKAAPKPKAKPTPKPKAKPTPKPKARPASKAKPTATRPKPAKPRGR